MTPNWLQSYLIESLRRDLCTEIHCTTCGAKEFRRGALAAFSAATGRGLRQEFDRAAVVGITKALSLVAPSESDALDLVGPVRCLLFDLWSGMPCLDNDVEALLGDSWAGGILRGMKEHHATRQAERRTRVEFQDPANIQKRREEKKQMRREQHEKRLAIKKERDRTWRTEQGKAG